MLAPQRRTIKAHPKSIHDAQQSELQAPECFNTAVTAGLEVGAGLALVVAPALVIRLVLGLSDIETSVVLGRLAGAALLSLGAACWGARHDVGSAAARGLVSGLLIYNAAVVALALSGSFGSLGPLL